MVQVSAFYVIGLFTGHSTIPHRSNTQLINGQSKKAMDILTKKWGRHEGLVRKCVVKVVLSREQREILSELSTRLGTSESEAMRMALMDYIKELSLMTEALHHKKRCEKDPEKQ
ncbi:MAG: hypothetical protein M1540_02385 [Candidatus Bathyarchaeota archaeon]|nr:hypothetical protein [Chloroflexota bacterium]MCL5876642.1 hypothetical protein [Candidatus Bathyarchaeota archaeon]